MPSFTAGMRKSSKQASSCARRKPGSGTCTAVTPRVCCAVSAASTLSPCTPWAAKALRSAWMPAPPPESEPAMVSAQGGRKWSVCMRGIVSDPRRRSYNGGMIAIREAWRAGLFKRAHWAPNIGAGLIVGVVALPLAMAFAIASGVKPEQGLYTAIIAGAAVALFGGTRIQIAGPTGAFIVILAGVVAQFGVEGLLLATLMAGVMLVLMGLARFGAVIRYIPDPVIVGFTAGIAVIIWVG